MNEEPAQERQKQHFDEIENLDESDTVSSYISRLDEVRIDQPLNLLHSPDFVENTSQEEGEVEVCNQDIREPLISVGMKEGQGSDILELGHTDETLETLTEVKARTKHKEDGERLQISTKATEEDRKRAIQELEENNKEVESLKKSAIISIHL